MRDVATVRREQVRQAGLQDEPLARQVGAPHRHVLERSPDHGQPHLRDEWGQCERRGHCEPGTSAVQTYQTGRPEDEAEAQAARVAQEHLRPAEVVGQEAEQRPGHGQQHGRGYYIAKGQTR